MPSLETAARSLKIEQIIAPVHSVVEMETAIIDLGHEPRGGLVLIPDVFTNAHRAAIAHDPHRPPKLTFFTDLPASQAIQH